jgi:hypothetical protein
MKLDGQFGLDFDQLARMPQHFLEMNVVGLPNGFERPLAAYPPTRLPLEGAALKDAVGIDQAREAKGLQARVTDDRLVVQSKPLFADQPVQVGKRRADRPAHSEGPPMMGKKSDRTSVAGKGEHGGIAPHLTHQGGEFRSEQGVAEFRAVV